MITFCKLLLHNHSRELISGVDASDNTIMFDMLSWFGKNRDNPSNILYIGDDGGCISETLNTLSMKQHNILLAVPSQAHADADEYLTAAASTIWLWPTLVSGGSPMYTEQVTLYISLWNSRIIPSTTLN
jgi:hypothetical protein